MYCMQTYISIGNYYYTEHMINRMRLNRTRERNIAICKDKNYVLYNIILEQIDHSKVDT